MLPGDTASQAALNQTAADTSLRVAGLDLYPRAGLNVMYDDNLLISPNNPLRDWEWTLLPGLTATAGDLGSYLPGPVTLSEIRDLRTYALLDDGSLPQHYLGVDYSPAVNFFTDNSKYNGVDQIEGLSGGYAFSRLFVGLDQDFAHVTAKDNSVGDRVTTTTFNTRVPLRYELTDRTSIDVSGQYHFLSYADPLYHGYQEFRNEDWYNRLFGAKLQLGLGAAFGFVAPEASPNQTYQQALARAIYVISGKLDVRGSAGLEFRQYDSRQTSTTDPVFTLAATYQPRASTTFNLEGYRRQEPSYSGNDNNITLGAGVGVRQLLLGRLTALLNVGYENVDYVVLGTGNSNDRVDNYYLVRANLQYEVNRHLTATLFWIYRQDASNKPLYSYVDNMIGVRANWYY